VACVNTGVCVFPRYTECPIQPYTHNGELNITNHKLIKMQVKEAFNEIRYEAVPIAKDGMTMKNDNMVVGHPDITRDTVPEFSDETIKNFKKGLPG